MIVYHSETNQAVTLTEEACEYLRLLTNSHMPLKKATDLAIGYQQTLDKIQLSPRKDKP